VNGFRYNARVLAEHLAQRLGGQAPSREPVADLVQFLLAELSGAPELWVQKGYLCHVVSSEGDGRFVDDGVVPLAHFLDTPGPDAFAASVEVDEAGTIIPTLYLRRRGEINEHQFEPHPLHRYDSEPYRAELSALIR
jgi:hypothetical protein